MTPAEQSYTFIPSLDWHGEHWEVGQKVSWKTVHAGSVHVYEGEIYEIMSDGWAYVESSPTVNKKGRKYISKTALPFFRLRKMC
jgi:hypothetical protein